MRAELLLDIGTPEPVEADGHLSLVAAILRGIHGDYRRTAVQNRVRWLVQNLPRTMATLGSERIHEIRRSLPQER